MLRSLVAGAALLTLGAITAATGVVRVGDAAAAGTIVTFMLVMGLVLFDGSWEAAEDRGEPSVPVLPVTQETPVAEAGSTAA